MNRFFLGWSMVVVLGISAARAQVQPSTPLLPDYDTRKGEFAKNPFTAPAQRAAATQLRAAVPKTKVHGDLVIGTPSMIYSSQGFLTSPRAGFKAMGTAGATTVVQGFLNQYSILFGQDATLLNTAVVTRDSVSPQGGMRQKIWEQQLDGVPVYNGKLVASTTAQGQLMRISSRMVPNLIEVANTAVPNHTTLVANPPISAREAVARAGASIGVQMITAQVTGAGQKNGWQLFTAPPLLGKSYLRLTWLPTGRSALRLCWDVTVSSKALRQAYRVLVDAQTGQPLLRRSMTRYLTDASYFVWPFESPAPLLPGCPRPCTLQAPHVPRTMIVTGAWNAVASPDGWIPDGADETAGNNVIAGQDFDGDDIPDQTTPGSSFREFNYVASLLAEPETYPDASVAQLFYYLNKSHDILWELGFDEAAGNMQTDNYGRGGSGDDPLLVNAQSVNADDNAYAVPAPDGLSPQLAMGLWGAGAGFFPRRDSGLQEEIAVHEVFHAVSDRLDGGLTYADGMQSGAMQEGWSDAAGLIQVVRPLMNPDFNYPSGTWLTRALGLDQNYYYGIRRYPYSTDITKNPLTYKDIDAAQADPHVGVPKNPQLEKIPADEVHAAGEVWAVALWEMHAEFIKKYGDVFGSKRALQLIMDGIKLLNGGGDPSFLQGRDAILAANVANYGNADYMEIWRAFAKRGMGMSAESPGGTDNAGVWEAFDIPLPVTVVGTIVMGGNGNTVIDPNECVDFSVILSNGMANTVQGEISASLKSLTPGVYVVTNQSTYPTIPGFGVVTNLTPFQVTIGRIFPCGSTINFVLTIKTAEYGFLDIPFSVMAGDPTAVTVVSFNNDTPLAIPDLGDVFSSILITGRFIRPIKVSLSLHLQHTFDNDLRLSFNNPAGTAIVLSTKNGGGDDNYGTNCTLESRTTFDDDAPLLISDGTAPFVGAFQPEVSLKNFIGKNPNGYWHLRIQDQMRLDVGTLNCWSLNFTEPTCIDGGGTCLPLPQICVDPPLLDFGTVSMGAASPPQTLFVSSCGDLPVAITNFTVVGTNATSFGVYSAPCIGTVMPTGTFCDVKIIYTPKTNAYEYAELRIDCSDPGSPYFIPLTGYGLVCDMILGPPVLPSIVQGIETNYQLELFNGTIPVRFIRTAGDYPPGMTMDLQGMMTGTPTTVGNYSWNVRAIDSTGCATEKWYTWQVLCPLVSMMPESLPVGQISNVYDVAISATGGKPPYTYAQGRGSLPEGLSLSTEGRIFGIPVSLGSSFEVKVTDAQGCLTDRWFTLELADPPPAIIIDPDIVVPALRGRSYRQTFTAKGGTGPHTFALASGTLPAGMTLTSDGVLAGTADQPGSYGFAVAATDAKGRGGARAYTLTVSVQPVDLAVDLVANTNTVTVGGVVHFTLTVTNLSAIAATDVTVTGTLWVANLGTLEAGASVTTNKIRGMAEVGLTTNTASVTCAEFDSNPTNNVAQAVTTVTDVPVDPVTSWVKFDTGAYLAGANIGSVAVLVTRSGATDTTVTVQYATSNGTGVNGAVAGRDYQMVFGTLAFLPGVTTQSFSVTVTNNPASGNGSKTVNLTLSNPSATAGLGGRSQATLVIHRQGKAANFMVFSDADGDQVTVRLLGTGKATLMLANGGTGPVGAIVLTGTDAKSKLKIRVKKVKISKDVTSDGRLAVGTIISDRSLKQIDVPQTDVTGAGIAVTGTLDTVSVRSVTSVSPTPRKLKETGKP